MIVTDINSSAGESPVTPDFVKEVLTKTNATTANDLISDLLAALAKKSSKHKFIVQATSVKTDDASFNLKLSADFGAVWESERDGYINVKVQLHNEDKENSASTVSEEPELKRVERADTLGGILDHYIDSEVPERLLVSIFWIFVG